jgi:hypothetical protein
MLESLFPKEQYPDGHPLLAERLSEVGACLAAAGRNEAALEYGQRGLAMCDRLFTRQAYPAGHPVLAKALYNVGLIHETSRLNVIGKEASERHERNGRAAETLKALAVPPGDHDVRSTHSSKSWPYLHRSHEMFQGLLHRILADSSEAEGLNYVSSLPPTLELMLSPFVRLGAEGGDITPVEFLYNSVVERKAALSRVMQQRRRFLASTTDPEVRSLGLKLQETRRELANLLLLQGESHVGGLKVTPNGIAKGGDLSHTPETPLEAGTGVVYDLVRKKEQIERDVAERMPPNERILQKRNLAAELRRALPPHTALVSRRGTWPPSCDGHSLRTRPLSSSSTTEPATLTSSLPATKRGARVISPSSFVRTLRQY